MDTSVEYIEMCDCEEIQKNKKEYKTSDWYRRKTSDSVFVGSMDNFAYLKFKANKPTWEQKGIIVRYPVPFGYIVRIIHRIFIKFKIFNAWMDVICK